MKHSTSFNTSNWNERERAEIQNLLEQKLSFEHISSRPGSGGVNVSYVESWKAIELANAVFGFNGWNCSIVDITPDFIDHEQGFYKVGVTAVVRVELKDGTHHEDIGYGMNKSNNKGQAIENAKKEAVSDARKRALRVFGNFLGNSVYDRLHISAEKMNKKKTTAPVCQPPITYEGIRCSIGRDTVKAPSNPITILHTDDVKSTSKRLISPNEDHDFVSTKTSLGSQEIENIFLTKIADEDYYLQNKEGFYTAPMNGN